MLLLGGLCNLVYSFFAGLALGLKRKNGEKTGEWYRHEKSRTQRLLPPRPFPTGSCDSPLPNTGRVLHALHTLHTLHTGMSPYRIDATPTRAPPQPLTHLGLLRTHFHPLMMMFNLWSILGVLMGPL